MSRYNGWENRETWAVGLILGNTEWIHNACLRIARKGSGPGEVADLLKKFVEEDDAEDVFGIEGIMERDFSGTLAADLMNAALARVNWLELAKDYIRTAKEVA